MVAYLSLRNLDLGSTEHRGTGYVVHATPAGSYYIGRDGLVWFADCKPAAGTIYYPDSGTFDDPDAS